MIGCAGFGFFNAYEQLSKADDLDFVVHVGDYIYEVSLPDAISASGRQGHSRLCNAQALHLLLMHPLMPAIACASVFTAPAWAYVLPLQWKLQRRHLQISRSMHGLCPAICMPGLPCWEQAIICSLQLSAFKQRSWLSLHLLQLGRVWTAVLSEEPGFRKCLQSKAAVHVSFPKALFSMAIQMSKMAG